MTGAPAAVVTTSGTAVANLHPAVLEAHHGRVPLVVLAADRPGRLHGTWANQTTDLQSALFGAATRLTRVLAPDDDPAVWAAAIRESVVVAKGLTHSPAGPVFLDVGFDEPLVPDEVDGPWHPLFAGGSGGDRAPLLATRRRIGHRRRKRRPRTRSSSRWLTPIG